MVEINKEMFETVNKPGRVGVLGTANKAGQPNAAKTIVAAVAFEVTETRGLIDWQG